MAAPQAVPTNFKEFKNLYQIGEILPTDVIKRFKGRKVSRGTAGQFVMLKISEENGKSEDSYQLCTLLNKDAFTIFVSRGQHQQPLCCRVSDGRVFEVNTSDEPLKSLEDINQTFKQQVVNPSPMLSGKIPNKEKKHVTWDPSIPDDPNERRKKPLRVNQGFNKPEISVVLHVIELDE